MNKDFPTFVETTTALEHRREALMDRLDAVLRNASRRMRGLEPLRIPPKPAKVLCPVAYDMYGRLVGRIEDPDEVPAGGKVKWEEAVW